MLSAKDLFFAKPATAAYTIAKSLRFRSSASAYLSRTPGAASNRTTYTWSGWVKRGTLGVLQGLFGCGSTASDTDYLYLGVSAGDNIIVSGGITTFRITNAVFRDPSAWYHIVLTVDTTNATANNRILLYINGVSQSFSTTNNPALSANTGVNQAALHSIFRRNAADYGDGYLSEVNFIDGQALDPTYFGQTDTATGVWMPKAYTGSYGTNGFYLKFADASAATAAAIGKDSSGNGNNWTPTNISVTAGVTYDSMVDTPTNYDNGGNGAGNYCVLNPLSFNSSNVVDGNLAYLGANNTSTRATFATPTSGKWYWELTPVNASPNYVGFGLMGASTTGANNFGTAAAGVWGMYPTGTMYISNNGSIANSGISTPALGVVFAAAYDADTGNFWIGYASSGSGSPTWFNSTGGTTGNPATGANPMATIAAQTLFPAVSGNNTTSDKSAINFGQRPFALTVPTGFKALCTQNLPTPTIGATSSTLANKYFDISLWTGNATSPRSITGLGFQPDFAWIKNRSDAINHVLYDAVRGAGSGKALSSNSTLQEGLGASSDTANGYLSAFNSDGISITAGSSTSLYVNTSPNAYVAWQWKANGSGSSNTSGSITSTVSANVTAGFSVVTFTVPNSASPQTFGHGLGVAPGLVILKYRSTTSQWFVYHKSLPSTYVLLLNSTAAQNTTGTYITAVSSSTVSLGSGLVPDATTPTAVAYCFAEVAGYSKFGSYTGNGSADGPFVYCGFRPRYILTKRTDSTGNWEIYDTARDSYNVMSADLSAESSAAETSTARFDALSNGFKIRTTGAATNASGGTYIFAAFAESPFNYARAR